MNLRPDTLAGRLTRTLILWVGGVWLACVLAVVWYVDREIDYNFDSELVEVSHRMFDVTLDRLDSLLNHGASNERELTVLVSPPDAFKDAAVPFQIVDDHTRVLARSADTSASQFDVPLAPGFSNTGAWRVYTVRHPQRALFLQVADPLQERSEAVNRTLLGLIVPLSAVLPMLALLLRGIARQELRVLDDLSGEVALRDGNVLHPIELLGLPQELRSVKDHVNRLLERLAAALDVERALAANAAHELRTPLAVARVRLQTALDHGLARSEVEAALTALQTLSHRTEKLLQLSRAESSAPLAREPVDLVQLATTVAEEFWQEARAVDRLDLHLPDSATNPVVLGDFDALAIALRNLVENALQHGGTGAVELRVGPGCCLSVGDDGLGVPLVALEHLKVRHVRHGAQPSANQVAARPGYGLGLSIVTTIAQKHDAQWLMESPPPGKPHGLLTTLVLPPAPTTPATSPAESH